MAKRHKKQSRKGLGTCPANDPDNEQCGYCQGTGYQRVPNILPYGTYGAKWKTERCQPCCGSGRGLSKPKPKKNLKGLGDIKLSTSAIVVGVLVLGVVGYVIYKQAQTNTLALQPVLNAPKSTTDKIIGTAMNILGVPSANTNTNSPSQQPQWY
jgi:hypothetical protein